MVVCYIPTTTHTSNIGGFKPKIERKHSPRRTHLAGGAPAFRRRTSPISSWMRQQLSPTPAGRQPSPLALSLSREEPRFPTPEGGMRHRRGRLRHASASPTDIETEQWPQTNNNERKFKTVDSKKKGKARFAPRGRKLERNRRTSGTVRNDS
jgi:hypothetical protein